MMNWEIKNAKFKDDYSIDIEFADGLTGTAHIKQSRLIRVFAPLKDSSIFLRGFIKYGAITWDTGEYEVDLAPDRMYKDIKDHGVYVFE